MDVQTAAPGPALALGVAVAAGALALALAVALLVSRRRPPRAAESPAEPPPPGVYPDDDLPSFREHPPGFPGARTVPAAGPARAAASGPAGGNPVRALTAMALAALLLIAAAAAVASAADPPSAADPSVPSATAAPTTAAPMSVPAAPTAGQPGAGALASASVPVGERGTTARVTFGGVVLEHRAVGITVTYPSVSVTAADDATALAHVRLPTWNCMTDDPPDDPAAAGCRASVPEYADLPAPALAVSRSGEGLRLHGRFPTYTRPNGTPPVYTGRVYELTVTLRPGHHLQNGWRAAAGELFLGDGRAGSVDDDAVSTMRSGG